MSLERKMRKEVQANLKDYLDSSRCFNSTKLAEEFMNQGEDEDECFDTAVTVGEWATKTI